MSAPDFAENVKKSLVTAAYLTVEYANAMDAEGFADGAKAKADFNLASAQVNATMALVEQQKRVADSNESLAKILLTIGLQ